jgi:hypothetical protein
MLRVPLSREAKVQKMKNTPLDKLHIEKEVCLDDARSSKQTSTKPVSNIVKHTVAK